MHDRTIRPRTIRPRFGQFFFIIFFFFVGELSVGEQSCFQSDPQYTEKSQPPRAFAFLMQSPRKNVFYLPAQIRIENLSSKVLMVDWALLRSRKRIFRKRKFLFPNFFGRLRNLLAPNGGLNYSGSWPAWELLTLVIFALRDIDIG